MKGQMRRLAAAALLIATIGTMMTGCSAQKVEELVNQAEVKQTEEISFVEPKSNEPTEEELQQIEDYRVCVYNLNKYLEEGTISCRDENGDNVRGSEALGVFYRRILKADAVDKWVGTEYTADESTNWNRQEVLSNFTVVEDVKLILWDKVTDHVGNTNNFGPYYNEWTYGNHGQIATIREYKNIDIFPVNPLEIYAQQHNVYDENGRLSEIRYMSGSEIRYLSKLHYNEEGKLIQEDIAKNDGEGFATYEYDEEGKMTGIFCRYQFDAYTNDIEYSFEYDQNSNVIKKKIMYYQLDGYNDNRYLHDITVAEYEYDAQNLLVKAVVAYQDLRWYKDGREPEQEYEKVDVYEYHYDENNRLESVHISYGSEMNVNTGEEKRKASHASSDLVFEYGNYYLYSVYSKLEIHKKSPKNA